MPERVSRPTLKLIRAGYWLAFLILFAAVFVYNQYLEDQPAWPLALVAMLLIWPLKRHVRRNFTRMTITGDKLRCESGILSKSMRTIQISKVQDVRVDQSLGQRILRIGDLSVETAGETSRLTIHNIDRPQEIADEVIEAAAKHGGKGKRG